MAKVGFWLNGAKGKLAGAALQKGEKGTVARQLVTPKNPQTSLQMAQRIAFGTVTSAAKFVLPMVGYISIEGLTDPVLAKREFVRMNVARLKKIALENGKGAFLPKGVSQLIPNPYFISKGSLPQPLGWTAEVVSGGGSDVLAVPAKSARLTVGENYTAADLWSLLMGLNAGQQLTRAAILTVSGANKPYVTDNEDDCVRYSRFFADRLVLNAEGGTSITIAAGTTAADIYAVLASLINTEATASTMMFNGEDLTVSVESDVLTVSLNNDAAPCDLAYDTEGFVLQALGYFISQFKNQQWCYSTSQMACLPSHAGRSIDEDTFYGLSAAYAIDTYMKKSATGSDRFTQKGGEDDTINGEDF